MGKDMYFEHARWHRAPHLIAAGVVLSLCGVLAACGDSAATPTSAGRATPENADTAAAAAAGEKVIELTDDGFAPDTVEVPQGTRLILKNSTDEEQSVVVKGRDFETAEGDRITIPAGESLDLNVHQLGAYVLTLGDDPRVTASVFIT